MLVRGGDGRSDCSEAHGDTAPARNGGEFGGALHGFADIAKVVGGTSVDGDGRAFGGVERRGSHDGKRIREGPIVVKYFVIQSMLISRPRFGGLVSRS